MDAKERARELYYGTEWDKTETHGDCVALITRTIYAAVAEAVAEKLEDCRQVCFQRGENLTTAGEVDRALEAFACASIIEARARAAASAEEGT